MQLLDHVSISVKNLNESRLFYDRIMEALGCEKVYDTGKSLGYGVRCKAGEEGHTCLAVYESSCSNIDDARHWCFKALSNQMVVKFYQSGIESGGSCNGKPGIRNNYHENYFAAFLYDPSGNRVEAVCHSKEL